MAVNIVQTCVIRAYRSSRGRSESIPFALREADLRQALRLISDMVEPPNGADWTPIRRTALIDAYQAFGYLLLGEDAPQSRRKKKAISQVRYVASYDPWRFEQLEVFRKEICEKDSEARRRLLFQ
ncbi:hypothetical protein D3C87_1699910 [compost metagenome]